MLDAAAAAAELMNIYRSFIFSVHGQPSSATPEALLCLLDVGLDFGLQLRQVDAQLPLVLFLWFVSVHWFGRGDVMPGAVSVSTRATHNHRHLHACIRLSRPPQYDTTYAHTSRTSSWPQSIAPAHASSYTHIKPAPIHHQFNPPSSPRPAWS